MAEFEWQDADSVDLVRRDRLRLLQQGTPLIVASGLVALWLKSSAPVWAALCLGMCMAWSASVVSQLAALRSRWKPLQIGPQRVQLGDESITWEAPHGFRVLRWDALQVRRLGATWVLLVKGHEAAFLPNRCLDAAEASRLAKQLPGARS